MFKIPFLDNRIHTEQFAEVVRKYNNISPAQYAKKFEAEFASYLGVQNVVALNSGTSAIHLALKAVGVGAGDLVICPTFTYIASASPILYLGAQPVLIDSEPETWNMDPVLLKKALEELKPTPKAIIVVDVYGEMPLMDELLSVASDFNIPVIEDAAEAIGSSYKNKKAGTFGDLSIFSFNNNKTFTGFGGGCITVEDDEIAEKIRYWASHARDDRSYYYHKELGYNYLMNPFSALYLLSEINNIDKNIIKKRAIFNTYTSILFTAGFRTSNNNESFNNRWVTVLESLIEGKQSLHEVIKKIRKQSIEIRPVWKPLHQQPLLKKSLAYLNGTSEMLFNRGACFPCSLTIKEEEIVKVANTFNNLFRC